MSYAKKVLQDIKDSGLYDLGYIKYLLEHRKNQGDISVRFGLFDEPFVDTAKFEAVEEGWVSIDALYDLVDKAVRDAEA